MSNSPEARFTAAFLAVEKAARAVIKADDNDVLLEVPALHELREALGVLDEARAAVKLRTMPVRPALTRVDYK